MSDRVAVKPADAFEPGDREHVEVNGREVSVIYHGDRFYAILNQCAHDCGPVGKGVIRGKVVSDFETPGKRTRERFDDETPTITCPWHGWSYELKTGQHIGVESIALPIFEVVVEDGMVYLEP